MRINHSQIMASMTSDLALGTSLGLVGMSDDMDAGGDFSLADLAELDVSDIEEIRFESLPAGAYIFKIVEATLGEKPNKDGEQRFLAEFKVEIVEVKAVVKKGVEPESLVGKTHVEKFYIVPEKAPEGIGRIRAFLGDIGLNNAGKLGEVVEQSVEHIFPGKIAERPNRDDPSQKFASLRVDAKKKSK
jgi:hypothetical protein